MSQPRKHLMNKTTLINVVAALALFAGVVYLLQPQASSDPKDPLLISIGGESYSQSALPLGLKQALYNAELQAYNQRRQILQAAAIELYIAQQANDNNETIEQVEQRLLPSLNPSDEQIQAFYQANQNRIQSPFEQAKPEIARFLARQLAQQQRRQLIDKLVDLNELQLHIEPPRSDAIAFELDGFPSKGDPDAKVTLVEFADYQCPHCRNAHQLLKQLLPQYLDRIRYVYLDFPINRSGISRKVAEGAVCADRQQRYWDYQDLAFERQAQLNEAAVTEMAAALKLDRQAFSACLQDPSTAEQVKRAEQQAIGAGVTGTPSFFINGHRVNVQNSLEQELPMLLDKALSRL